MENETPATKPKPSLAGLAKLIADLQAEQQMIYQRLAEISPAALPPMDLSPLLEQFEAQQKTLAAQAELSLAMRKDIQELQDKIRELQRPAEQPATPPPVSKAPVQARRSPPPKPGLFSRLLNPSKPPQRR